METNETSTRHGENLSGNIMETDNEVSIQEQPQQNRKTPWFMKEVKDICNRQH